MDLNQNKKKLMMGTFLIWIVCGNGRVYVLVVVNVCLNLNVVRFKEERKRQRNVGGRRRRQEKEEEKRNVQRKRDGGGRRKRVEKDN